MAKNLVIIEATGKLKKIKSFLGKDFEVMATIGHIADLPADKLSVNIKKQFEPTFAVLPDKENVVKSIVSAVKKSDCVYIMTDLDREGSGIGWLIAQQFPPNTKVKRAKADAITQIKILEAIQNATDMDVDKNLVESFITRRILDRIVGYKCSYVTKQATGGTSAGRVQSAALRIVAEREKEIQAFIPQEYWPVEAELITTKYEKIIASIKNPDKLKITTEAEAKKITERIKKGPVVVSKFEKKEIKASPYAPFTTSTLLQSAASVMKWSTDKTMKVAQTLYQDGACTYHRTDSTVIIPDFVNDIRQLALTKYGQQYVPSAPNVYVKKQKGAQEAHEACRVTDLSLQNYGTGDASALYKMIWKRTVASQMEKARTMSASVEFSCDQYIMSASGSKLLFDGFRKVWDYSSSQDSELPELTVGDKVNAIDIRYEQKFTQPPPRYSEQALVKKLEAEGIGRPATYSSIFETLKKRKYIETKKNSIHTTDLGIKVTDFLVTAKFCFVDIGFTAEMESRLDEIAEGASKVDVLDHFWQRLKGDIENAKTAKNKMNETDIDCPKCKNGKLVKKHSKYGSFFSCSLYSSKDDKCDYTADVGEDGQPKEKVKKKVEASEYECPKCGKPMMIRESKYGKFLGCGGYSQGCRTMMDLEGKLIVKKIKYKKSKKE